MKLTKKQEIGSINVAKSIIQNRFTEMYGFAPALKDIIPLEASYNYDHDLEIWFCDSLGFRIRGIGYGWSAKYGLARNEAYDM